METILMLGSMMMYGLLAIIFTANAIKEAKREKEKETKWHSYLWFSYYAIGAASFFIMMNGVVLSMWLNQINS